MGTEVKLHPSWLAEVGPEFSKPYFRELKAFLLKEKQEGQILYPPGNAIFAALDHTPFDRVKAVILGQDPYHGKGQANGMCFSVSRGLVQPPSLKNIFRELNDDLQIAPPVHGDLSSWADHGVLLLNAVLTVRANQAASHQNKGWEIFTDTLISCLSQKRSSLVFLLWGSFARSKKHLIDTTKHRVLEAAHPSPFSAHQGFLGCRHFSKTNQYLREQGIAEIDWHID